MMKFNQNSKKLSFRAAIDFAIVLIVMLAMCLNAQAADGDIQLTPEKSQSVTVPQDTKVYLTYTPTKDGMYNFYSTGNYDTVVRLYVNDEEVAYSDDDGEYTNFSLNVEMKAGTEYRFEVYSYHGDDITFDVTLIEVAVSESVEIFGGKDSLSLVLSESVDYDYELYPAGSYSTVNFVSSNESVVRIDEKSLLAVGIGTATVTATISNGSQDTITVTVSEPSTWTGEKTETILQTSNLNYDIFKFSVSEDGYYEIFSVGDFDTYLEVYDEEFYFIKDSEDYSDKNFHLINDFQKGEIYYLVVKTNGDESARSFDMTVKKTENIELPDLSLATDVSFDEDSITVGLFDSFIPSYNIVPAGCIENVTFSSSDSSVLNTNTDSAEIVAVGVGTATLTITTESGLTDTIKVTVTEATISFNSPLTITIDDACKAKGYKFVAPANGTYAIKSTGTADALLQIYDGDMSDYDRYDDIYGYNFYTEIEMLKGDTYYLQFKAYDDECEYEVIVTKPSIISSVELSIDEDLCLNRNGDTYYVSVNTYYPFVVEYGEASGAMADYYKIEADNENIVECSDSDICFMEAGTVNVTITVDEYTDTITIVAIDFIQGDVNSDGKVDAQDLITVMNIVDGEITVDNNMKALADFNNDNKVDATDIEIIAEEVGIDPDSIGTTEATFTVKHNLNLLDLVQIGYWFTATPDSADVEFVDYGILIWDEESYLAETDFTINSKNAYQPEVSTRAGFQMGYGEGVYAQYLDTKYYAIPYAVTSYGEYVYSDTPDVYSIPIYATEDGFKSSTDEELKTVVYDLLNYATFAQWYFMVRSNPDVDVNTFNPINSVLDGANRASRYKESMLVSGHDISKNTDKSLDSTWLYTTANLEEAIAINFFAEQSNDFTGMLYWTAEDFAAADVLEYGTQSGRAPVVDRTIYGSDTSTGQIPDIYPKDISDPIYACMYSDDDEGTYYGEIRVDSIAAYLTRAINGTEVRSTEDYFFLCMCQTMLAYGDSAKAYAE